MGKISLAEAAMLMKCSYLVARDRLLRGQLEGGRDDSGRFWVRRASAERVARGPGEPVGPPKVRT